MGFPDGSLGKESACKVGDLGSIPGLGRTLEKGTTHSCILAWRIPETVKSMGLQRVCIVHGVAKSQTGEGLSLYR